jgi:hypothetical protein
MPVGWCNHDGWAGGPVHGYTDSHSIYPGTVSALPTNRWRFLRCNPGQVCLNLKVELGMSTPSARDTVLMGPVRVLRALTDALPKASPEELVNATRLLESTCSVVARILQTKDVTLSSPGSAIRGLLHCLVDVYELVVPLLAALVAENGLDETPRLRGVCRSCQEASYALIRASASGATVSSGIADGTLLDDFFHYEAGSELSVRPEAFPTLGISVADLHARGALSVDVCAQYRVLAAVRARAAVDGGLASGLATAATSAQVDAWQELLERRKQQLSGANTTGPAASGIIRFDASSSVSAVLEILPGLQREAVAAALRDTRGDVAAAVERLLAQSDGRAASTQPPPPSLPQPMPRRGDAVQALDPALKAATLRRAAGIAVADAAADAEAAAAALRTPAPPDARSAPRAEPPVSVSAAASLSAAAAALIERSSALLYEDEWDDSYDDVEHLDVPDQPGGSDDDGDDGAPGTRGAGRGSGPPTRPPPSAGAGAGGHGPRGGGAAKSGAASRGHPPRGGAGGERSRVAADAAASGSDGAGDSGDGGEASAPTLGAGRGRGQGRGRGGGGAVTGHGPRAKGGLTEHDAERRRELKARIGNHNRKRGADRKLAAGGPRA